MLFAIAAGILIPAALQIVAKFPLYYFWMVFIPLAIALASHLSNVNLSPAFRKMVYSLLVAGALFGLPLRLAAIALNWHSFSQQPIDAFVAKNLSPADAVVSDFKAYYPVKLNCKEMFAPTYVGIMQPEERTGVTALLMRPDEFPGSPERSAASGRYRTLDAGLDLYEGPSAAI